MSEEKNLKKLTKIKNILKETNCPLLQIEVLIKISLFNVIP